MLSLFLGINYSKKKLEIGDRTYSIVLHEVLDCFRSEHVAFIIRYVDANGQVQERFMDFLTHGTFYLNIQIQ